MENPEQHGEIMTEMRYLRRDFAEHTKHIDEYMETTEKRLRSLEDWKLTFVAKFSVYSAIALFLGSALAQVVLSVIIKRV